MALTQLLLAPLAAAQTPAPAPAPAVPQFPTVLPGTIGSIADPKAGSVGEGKVTVDYSYSTDSRLILVIRGVEMDGALKGVGGELAVKGNQIQISPEEIYGEKGKMEATKFFTIRYIIPDLAPGIYRLLHDDSKAAGADRVVDLSLDLRKPVKKTLVVADKAPAAAPAAAEPKPAPAPVIKEDP